MQKHRRKSIKNYFCTIKVFGKSEISQKYYFSCFSKHFFYVLVAIFLSSDFGEITKKGCSLSWNSQNYHFPFSGAGAGAQNIIERKIALTDAISIYANIVMCTLNYWSRPSSPPTLLCDCKFKIKFTVLILCIFSISEYFVL